MMTYIPYEKRDNNFVHLKGTISHFASDRMGLFYDKSYSSNDPEIESLRYSRIYHNKISCRFVYIIKETSKFLYCENFGKSRNSQPFVCFEKQNLLMKNK